MKGWTFVGRKSIGELLQKPKARNSMAHWSFEKIDYHFHKVGPGLHIVCEFRRTDFELHRSRVSRPRRDKSEPFRFNNMGAQYTRVLYSGQYCYQVGCDICYSFRPADCNDSFPGPLPEVTFLSGACPAR